MLAIVIPYYKITYFEETLQSLESQTDRRFKVYIGDDSSPENPTELLHYYKGLFDFEYFRFERNLGSTSLVKQWERSILLSNQEEWVMILGDDDVLDPCVVEKFYAQYEDFGNKTNLLRFSTINIDENIQKSSKIFAHPQWEMPGDSAFRRICGHTRSSLSEHIFKKEAYEEYGFYNYPLAWHSDDRAWLEFTEGKPIYSINETIVYIRNSALNISGKTDNEKEKYIASMEYYSYLLEKQLNQFSRSQKLEITRKYIALIQKSRSVKLSEIIRAIKIYILHADQKAYLHILKLWCSRFKKE